MPTGLLSADAVDQIVTTARTAIGDDVRSVTYFTKDDYEQLYLRDDLARDADLSTFIGHEWRGFQIAQAAYGDSELGDYNYTVRVFDNGFLVRITSDREGVFITTDGFTLSRFEEVAAALGPFLEKRAMD
ncbi:hypothetical protein OB905_00845 [Halobacteria archaeon AArc-dxtr1]|nr:hypothetical protein [Halobacteria archaeon AArc-dxtr1]